MSINQIARIDKDRRPLSGPPVAFFAAVAAMLAAAVAASALHWDYVFPLTASFAFATAAVIALFGWRKTKAPPQVSYLDVAGALVLIGLAAAALIDPAQLLRITGA
jgi:hypothetical protein